MFPKARRAMQIGVCAAMPVSTAALTAGSMLFKRQPNAAVAPLAVWETALAVASGLFVVVVVFALFGAVLARGGFTLRAFGAAVVNRRGEPAARLRCLWRAVVTWSLVPVMIMVLGTKASIEGAAVGTAILHSLPAALFAAGAVWAILHPSRSIQDRLAGTWIVPR
jgi:hypothetical protein